MSQENHIPEINNVQFVQVICTEIYRKMPELEAHDFKLQIAVESALRFWESFVNDVRQGNDI